MASKPPAADQESVWDYPRPPRLEATSKRLEVTFAGVVIASTVRGHRVLETSHPPTYYIPPEDVAGDHLVVNPRRTLCEFKGVARYYDLVVGARRSVAAAWCYPEPTPPFAAITGHFVFYASRVDRCSVDGELVEAQAGDFYGGWVTSNIVGPFKGLPGSERW